MAEKKKTNTKTPKRLYKSNDQKWIDGVCGGVAEYFNIDVTIVRILWFFSIFLNGLGVIAYITAMIVLPSSGEGKVQKSDFESKRNTVLIVGISLIFLGALILFNQLDFPFHWRYPSYYSFHRWWAFRGDIVFPLLLILGGIIYLVWIFNRNKNTVKKQSSTAQKKTKAFTRTMDNKMIGGVCGGLAEYFQIDVSFIRIGFVLLALLVNFLVALIIYIVLLIIMSQSK